MICNETSSHFSSRYFSVEKPCAHKIYFWVSVFTNRSFAEMLSFCLFDQFISNVQRALDNISNQDHATVAVSENN